MNKNQSGRDSVRYRHGASVGGVITPEYCSWSAMKKRCTNQRCKDFKDYGGRGISVCDRWAGSFPNFLIDMGKRPSPRHSIDRINNDGNYEPSNCRWALPTVQANNSRKRIRVRGEAHHKSKLNELQVRVMRRCGTLGVGNADMARLFHVTRQSVRSVMRRESWAHV